MPWSISLRANEILTVNGARIEVTRAVMVRVLDQAHVVLPNGTVREPREVKEDSDGDAGNG